MNGPLIAIDYCLQMKEITGRFDEEDMASAKKLLDRFKDTTSEDEYLATVGIINRLADLFKGGKR